MKMTTVEVASTVVVAVNLILMIVAVEIGQSCDVWWTALEHSPHRMVDELLVGQAMVAYDYQLYRFVLDYYSVLGFAAAAGPVGPDVVAIVLSFVVVGIIIQHLMVVGIVVVFVVA